MANQTAAVIQQKQDVIVVEYVPYGAQDKIKMNVSIVQNLIAVKTKSGKTCTDRDAIKFLAMCQAKRLNPFEGDAFLIGYDNSDGTASFSLITAHQTYLKRAELHPEFDGMKSGIIIRDVNHGLVDLEGDFYEEGQIVVGGWATVFFKQRKQPMHKRLRLERFRKPYGIWKDDAAGMICKCAEADALRSAFPTMLGGLYLREEVDAETLPAISKPDFSVSSKPPFVEGKTNGGTKPPEEPPIDQGEGTDLGPQEPPPKENPGYNPLKALRNLLKMAQVKEADLLDYWASSGATDGSHGTLEEVAMSNEALVRHTAENWKAVDEKMKQLRRVPE